MSVFEAEVIVKDGLGDRDWENVLTVENDVCPIKFLDEGPCGGKIKWTGDKGRCQTCSASYYKGEEANL